MLSKARVEEILTKTGVLMEGHFLLTSGRHSDKYMQCAKILQYPNYAGELISILAESFKDDKVDLVIAPATGGIIVGYELARQLNANNLFAERENDAMTLRRDFQIPNGARVVVAEDVITTGGTVMEVIELVKNQGGIVVGVGVIVDRSNGKIDFGVKKCASYTADVVSFEAADCPMCKKDGTPPVKPGSRK